MPLSTTTLRLILGDQLNALHSWFSEVRAEVVYVLLEVRQETDDVHHHAQRIIAIFAAMRALARQLETGGHRVHYLRIDDAANLQAIPANIDALLAHYGAGVGSFGRPDAARIVWPLDRAEALAHLDAFIQHGLPHFGHYQDAMHMTAARLFHSMLSFALNTKMLHPREVIAGAEDAWRAGHAPLHAVEGFIRQILGWREYVRGVYWANMPGYGAHNVFGHGAPLPSWFWDGKTKMRCLRHAIGQSLDDAHAHHIQRLMIIGNFSLLAGLEPYQVHQWYRGVYVDAFEWVEMPNTIGMSQFADGGLLATKPYVSGAAYIDRMSDYCKGCHYDKKARLGETACPFNALYRDFFERNAERQSGNQRLGMVYRNLSRMDDAARAACGEQAAALRARLEEL
ncbi:hypothetical protein F2P44_21715 [Massilia sp. CCM 8695]|uniref:Cryptochrome/photolyase family protein n=1 Tax=Massilia frigida TaxID=2609281 RepID=A0ABX0N973_9BURK|nr:cryptochrome/photolyase family protein [Massilia frigida]NHZ81873.1 hypothetical protein [Massilia frigida]